MTIWSFQNQYDQEIMTIEGMPDKSIITLHSLKELILPGLRLILVLTENIGTEFNP